MSIQQLGLPHHGKIPSRPHSVRLCLDVNRISHKFGPSGDSFYQLKEVCLLYEDAGPSSNIKDDSCTDRCNAIRNHNERCREVKPSVDHFKLSTAGPKSLLPLESHKMQSRYQRPCTTKRPAHLPFSDGNPSHLSSAKPRIMSSSDDGMRQELKIFKSLVLAKQEYRQIIDKSIDKFRRTALETKYFATVEALYACEDKLKKSRYGKYLPRFKQKILENNMLKSDCSESKDISLLPFSTTNTSQISRKNQNKLLQPTKSQYKGTLGKDVLTREKFFTERSDGGFFDLKRSDVSNPYDESPSNSQKKFGRYPFGKVFGTSLMQKSEFLNESFKTPTIHSGNLGLGNVADCTLKTSIKPLGFIKSNVNDERIASKAINLCLKYQRLKKVKLLAREKLENEINSNDIREKIENDYFQSQVKLERVCQKLNRLARVPGLNWEVISTLLSMNEEEYDLDHVSPTDGDRSRLSSTHTDLEGPNSEVPNAPISREYHDHDAEANKLQYFESLLGESRFVRVKTKNNCSTQNDDRCLYRSSSLQNKCVQTVKDDYDGCLSADDSTTEDNLERLQPTVDDAAVDENQNHIEMKKNLMKASSNVHKDMEYKETLQQNDSLDDMGAIRKKRLEYFKKKDRENILEMAKEDSIHVSEVHQQFSNPIAFNFDQDTQEDVDGDIHSFSKYEEKGFKPIPLSIIASRLLLPRTPYQNGITNKKVHSPEAETETDTGTETETDINGNSLHNFILYDVSDLSSQASFRETANNMMDGNCHGDSYYDESESDTDVKYHLYDTTDFENTCTVKDDEMDAYYTSSNIIERLQSRQAVDGYSEQDERNSHGSTDVNDIDQGSNDSRAKMSEDILEKLQQKSLPRLSLEKHLFTGCEREQNGDKASETSRKLIESQRGGFRESFLQRARPRPLSREGQTYLFDMIETQGNANENESGSLISRMVSMREKLQRKKHPCEVESLARCHENSIRSKLKNFKGTLQQNEGVESGDDVSKVEAYSVSDRSTYPYKKDIKEDVHDCGKKSEGLMKSMLENLDKLEKIENEANADTSIFFEDDEKSIKHPSKLYEDPLPWECKKVKTMLGKNEPMNTSDTQKNAFDENLMKAMAKDDFEETSCIMELKSMVSEDENEPLMDEELLERRLHDVDEMNFDMLELNESSSHAPDWDLASGISTQEMHPRTGESLRSSLAFDDNRERYNVISTRNEEILDWAGDDCSNQKEKPQARLQETEQDFIQDAAASLDRKGSVELLAMLDELEVDIEHVSEVAMSNGFIAFQSESERDAYTEYESDASSSSSRSILKSPLMKRRSLSYVETVGGSEEATDELLDWINANEETEESEAREIEMVEDNIMKVLDQIVEPSTAMEIAMSFDERENIDLLEKFDDTNLQMHEDTEIAEDWNQGSGTSFASSDFEFKSFINDEPIAQDDMLHGIALAESLERNVNICSKKPGGGATEEKFNASYSVDTDVYTEIKASNEDVMKKANVEEANETKQIHIEQIIDVEALSAANITVEGQIDPNLPFFDGDTRNIDACADDPTARRTVLPTGDFHADLLCEDLMDIIDCDKKWQLDLTDEIGELIHDDSIYQKSILGDRSGTKLTNSGGQNDRSDQGSEIDNLHKNESKSESVSETFNSLESDMKITDDFQEMHVKDDNDKIGNQVKSIEGEHVFGEKESFVNDSLVFDHSNEDKLEKEDDGTQLDFLHDFQTRKRRDAVDLINDTIPVAKNVLEVETRKIEYDDDIRERNIEDSEKVDGREVFLVTTRGDEIVASDIVLDCNIEILSGYEEESMKKIDNLKKVSLNEAEDNDISENLFQPAGADEALKETPLESLPLGDSFSNGYLDWDFAGDALLIASPLSPEEERGGLKVIDSNLCRENSFVNEAIVVELSHENIERRAEFMKIGPAGDFREEYRARADLQNLPEELLENLPLSLSPRSVLNSPKLLQGIFISESNDTDSRSQNSSPYLGLSDSDDELEFGQGYNKHGENDNVIISTICHDPGELTKRSSCIDGGSNSRRGEGSQLVKQPVFYEDTNSINDVGILLDDPGPNYEDTHGTSFANAWFNRSTSEENISSQRNDLMIRRIELNNHETNEVPLGKLNESRINVREKETSDVMRYEATDLETERTATEAGAPDEDWKMTVNDGTRAVVFNELEPLKLFAENQDSVEGDLGSESNLRDLHSEPNEEENVKGANCAVGFNIDSDNIDQKAKNASEKQLTGISDDTRQQETVCQTSVTRNVEFDVDDFFEESENGDGDSVNSIQFSMEDEQNEIASIQFEDSADEDRVKFFSEDSNGRDFPYDGKVEMAGNGRSDLYDLEMLAESPSKNDLPISTARNASLTHETSDVESDFLPAVGKGSDTEQINLNDESNKEIHEFIVAAGNDTVTVCDETMISAYDGDNERINEVDVVLTGTSFDGFDNNYDYTTKGDFVTTGNATSRAPEATGIPIVIDNGSGRTKAGLATSLYPSVVIPAIVGKPNYDHVMKDANSKDCYVGEQAERYRGVLKLTYPLEHGIVTDWDGMEKIWDHVFTDQLRADSSEHPVLITEAPLNPKKNRERMLEIMMETYRVPAFYVALQAVLSLYVSGMTTGMVVDSGDGVTHVVPVYDGYSLPHATERIDIAGRDLTEYLMRILMERGYAFKTSAEREICKDIKEKVCFVASDFQETMEIFGKNPDNIRNYMLPDGQNVAIGDERFRCPEILFQPSLIGKDILGIHDYVFKSIQRCSVDVRSDMYSNIVLSGGTTMLEGMDTRLKSELEQLVPGSFMSNIKIKGMQHREYSVWRGGAAFANLPSFSRMWIASDDYYEFGVDIVHKKCF